MKKNLLLFAVAFLLFGACQSDDSPNIEPRKDISLTRSEQEITNKGNAFAFNFFNQVNKTEEEDNFFISPLSASLALSMTTNGATGNTLEEIKTTLGFEEFSLAELNEYYKKLVAGLLNSDSSTDLGIANSIWIKEGYSVKQPFIDVNKQMYDAEVRYLDFSATGAVDVINGWCSDKTNKRIPKVLETIGSNARLFLINALYFKGAWVTKFDKKNTTKEDFTAIDGKKTSVEMMKQEAEFPYMSTEDFQMLQLPYGNEAFSMCLILPHSDKNIEDVISQLNADNWQKWYGWLGTRTVNIKLPRFKQEYSKVLNDDLKDMGMVLPFAAEADLTNIASGLMISLVKQDTFIEVNEEGTEAAAVTVVGMFESAGPEPPATPQFHANRPFIYLIKEKSTGAILFMGKLGSM